MDGNLGPELFAQPRSNHRSLPIFVCGQYDRHLPCTNEKSSYLRGPRAESVGIRIVPSSNRLASNEREDPVERSGVIC
jgi:hypothetical protein